MKTKKCTKCGEEKELTSDNFHISRKSSNGYTSRCKVCIREDNKATDLTLKPGERAQKTCIRCGETKEVNAENFNKQKTHRYGVASVCKACTQKHAKVKRQTEEGRLSAKNTRLKSSYGITIAEYNDMLSAQGGRCACCGRHGTEVTRLVLDHDHFSGKVREIICDDCNIALAMFNEDTKTMKSAIAYLDKAQEAHTNGA
jgi:hypothetical protein